MQRLQRLTLRFTLSLLALVWAAGCTQQGAAPPAPARESGKASVDARTDGPRTYELKGIVRALNRDTGIVTVRHEPIPGYMPAMTMPLPVVPPTDLDDVQIGDEIQAQLKVTQDDSHLEELVVTRPAPLEISLAGGKAELRQAIPVLQPGEEVPDFAFTDQSGETIRLEALRGKYVVLTFIYTRCPLPDFCPLMDKKFATIQQRIRAIPGRADHVRLLSISFDPEHDTPEILQKHAERVGAQPPLWSFGVATHEELRKVGPSLGLAYAPGEKEIMHNLSTAVIDPEGKLVQLYKGKAWEPETLMKEFLPLISRSSK